jgi:hypothetical protein
VDRCNLLWVSALAKEELHVTSLSFLRLGLRVMPPGLLVALLLASTEGSLKVRSALRTWRTLPSCSSGGIEAGIRRRKPINLVNW